MQEQFEIEHPPKQTDQAPIKEMHPIPSLLASKLALDKMRADPQRILQDNELGSRAKRPQEAQATPTYLRDEQQHPVSLQ